MAWMSEQKQEKDDEREEEEQEEEQFYSPKGSSSGNKQQHTLSSSSSPVVAVATTSSRSFNVFHFDKFGSKSFTSRTPSYPLSYTLSRSPSLSLSPVESVNSLPPHDPASPSFFSSQTTKLPPPPPPPLPPRFYETPVTESQNVNVDVRTETEEILKPKLKALHWDKVKASSDRAMVWDQLRPSSFQ